MKYYFIKLEENNKTHANTLCYVLKDKDFDNVKTYLHNKILSFYGHSGKYEELTDRYSFFNGELDITIESYNEISKNHYTTLSKYLLELR